MFSCPTNRSYFPPLSIIWADIAHDTVGAVKCTFSERSLDGQLVLLHPVIFFTAAETRSASLQGWMTTACDGIFEVGFDSYAGLLYIIYLVTAGPEVSARDATEVRV